MTVDITSPSLRTALHLTASDRRWIDFLAQSIQDTWDESNPSRPKDLGYIASEDFIRLQFEEYLLALLSAVKYHLYLQTPQHTAMSSIEGDPMTDFNLDWLDSWQRSPSYQLFNEKSESHLFDVVEPRHPTAGNLNFDDIQRRVAMQVQTLHLDERFATGREAFSKHLATGQKKVSTAFNQFWSDLETMRENQRRRAEMASHGLTEDNEFKRSSSPAPSSSNAPSGRFAARAPDAAAAQASLQAAGQKAGAYMSSWGTWAAERRKEWSKPTTASSGLEKENTNADGGESKAVPNIGRWGRWTSATSKKLSSGNLKEEKGGDGIGRLDA